MKRSLFVAFAALVCGSMLAGFLRVRKLAQSELGILSERMVAMAAGWDASKTPQSDRVVDIVISDAHGDPDPFLAPQEPGSLDKALFWLKRNLLGGSPAAAEPTPMTGVFADDPAAVVWAHEGFSTSSEEQMTREIMAAIIRAHDAGAETNIVAQGVAVPAAVKAVAALEGTVRGGEKVGVNKLVALGVSRPVLKRLDLIVFMNFTRPGNLREFVNVWRTDLPQRAVTFELFDASHDGTKYAAGELFPAMAEQDGLSEASRTLEIVTSIKHLVKSVDTMRTALDRLGHSASGRARAPESRPRTFRAALDGTITTRETGATSAGDPQDSLSLIRAGGVVKSGEVSSGRDRNAGRPPPRDEEAICRFITKARYDGSLGGISGADSKCKSEYPETVFGAAFSLLSYNHCDRHGQIIQGWEVDKEQGKYWMIPEHLLIPEKPYPGGWSPMFTQNARDCRGYTSSSQQDEGNMMNNVGDPQLKCNAQVPILCMPASRRRWRRRHP